jgi:hypothetical protein
LTDKLFKSYRYPTRAFNEAPRRRADGVLKNHNKIPILYLYGKSYQKTTHMTEDIGMKPSRTNPNLYMILLLIGWLMTACASTSYINVAYQLPAASVKLTNKAVFLDVKDMRTDKTFLSDTAQKEFKHFTGIFSLTLVGGLKDNMLGSFDVDTLFKEAFKRRLSAMEIQTAASQTANQPLMEIVLKEFFLDFKGRKWNARISFETRLVKDKGHVATQTVSAAAERLKTVGRGDAEKVLGEIFTDALNKVDISDLFQKLSL